MPPAIGNYCNYLKYCNYVNYCNYFVYSLLFDLLQLFDSMQWQQCHALGTRVFFQSIISSPPSLTTYKVWQALYSGEGYGL